MSVNSVGTIILLLVAGVIYYYAKNPVTCLLAGWLFRSAFVETNR